MAGPAPEAALLLAGVRSRQTEAGVARLEALCREDPDWDGVLRVARRHEVFPLLCRSLKALPAGSVPAPALDRLQEWSYATAARSLFLTTELLRLLDRLRAGGVLAVPFKGPLLGAAAYGSPALRSFADLDVLVDARDVPRAQRILAREGYRPALPLEGLRRLTYLQSECSFDFRREDDRVTVELHWGLMPRYFGFPLRLDHLRGRLTRVPLGDGIVPSLSAEDTLLFLCLHGTKHRWASLKWICDVAELVTAYASLDWEGVRQRAAAIGGERMLRLGLLLAAGLLEAPLPPEVVRWLPGDAVARALAAEVDAGLFASSGPPPGAGNLFYLRAMTSGWSRARYCLHLATIPTSEDWERLPLPPALAPGAYPLHVLWLLGRSVRAAGSSLWRSATSRRTAAPRLPAVKA
jgi:Uncharacterised nucleotidyltransferase